MSTVLRDNGSLDNPAPRGFAPPHTLKIMFCPVCAHDDRSRRLNDRHFAQGHICSGVPIELTYELISLKETKHGPS